MSDPVDNTIAASGASSFPENGDNDAKISTDNLRVTFFPPLQEQRRGWVLSILRRERVHSLVDIGCGEGSLLGCLCNPSRFLTGDAQSRAQLEQAPSDPKVSIPRVEKHVLEKAIQDEEDTELQTTCIMGLDIDRDSAQCCANATAPTAKEGFASDPFSFPRWSPLDVKIFCGSLTEFNQALVGVDCIVSTEVIEHLPPAVLPHFAPMLLGTYRPRLLLLTTPSYTYNARFSPPNTTDPSGFPDPTGRTNRVFRHADHKFEWTPDEFKEWCEGEAGRYGYELVKVGGVGRAREEDPWGRDGVLGWATQVAVFRRRERCGDEGGEREKGKRLEEGREEDRLPQVEDCPELGEGEGPPRMEHVVSLDPTGRNGADDTTNSNITTTNTNTNRRNEHEHEHAHELIAEHHYPAHPRAGKPLPRKEITSAVLRAMEEYYPHDGWTVWNLWVEEQISSACGGYLRELLDAVLSCDELELKTRRAADDDKEEGEEPVTRWKVLFSGSRHDEALAKMRREHQGWTTPSLQEEGENEEVDAKSQGNDQVLWEAGLGVDDDWQQKSSWASTTEGNGSAVAGDVAIGEEVDWGATASASGWASESSSWGSW